MDNEEKLFNLILAAEDQQKTAEQSLSDLSIIIDEFKNYDQRMRSNLAYMSECVNSMKGSAVDVKKVFSKSLPDFKQAILDTLELAADQSVSTASDRAADSLLKSFTPVLDVINNASKRAESAAEKLESNASYLSVKTIAFLFLGAASMVALGFALIGWQRYDYQSLKEQNAALSANLDNLTRKGGLLNIQQCLDSNNKTRLCIEVLRNSQIINTDENRSYIIPRGY